MDPRNIRLYQGSGSYFIKDQYQNLNEEIFLQKLKRFLLSSYFFLAK